MAIFGALAGLTAAGLYAVVDELRVSHRIRSYKLPGTIQVYDYTINDERFDGIIRRFENDWSLDGGTLYPEKLIGFFAENPKAREQWVRMQASIILHDQGMRRSCERDTAQFGDESNKYVAEFGGIEREWIYQRDSEAKLTIEKAEREYKEHIDGLAKRDKTDRHLIIVFLIVGLVIMILPLILMPYISSNSCFGVSCATANGSCDIGYNYANTAGMPIISALLLATGAGMAGWACAKGAMRKHPMLYAIGAALIVFIFPLICHS